MIGEEEIPGRVRRRTAQWLRLLKKIPRGKAMVTSEKELGVKASSVKLIVDRYVKNNLLPKGYNVITRTTGGALTIYIVNSAKQEGGE